MRLKSAACWWVCRSLVFGGTAVPAADGAREDRGRQSVYEEERVADQSSIVRDSSQSSPATYDGGKQMEKRSRWMFGSAPAFNLWNSGTLIISGELIPVDQPLPEVRHNPNLTNCIRNHLHTHPAPIISKVCCFVAEVELLGAATTAREKTDPQLLVDSRRPSLKPKLSLAHPVPYSLPCLPGRSRWISSSMASETRLSTDYGTFDHRQRVKMSRF